MSKKYALYINNKGFGTISCSNEAIEVANNINVEGSGYVGELIANADSKKLQVELNKIFGNNRYMVDVKEDNLMRPKELYIIFSVLIALGVSASIILNNLS